MKKKDIVNLIRYHSEHNESGFRAVAADIAREFEATGDSQLAAYVMSLISSVDTFVPQAYAEDIPFLRKEETFSSMLLLPELISNDIRGVINAVNHKQGINKFIFEGAPGTGKTEAARHLARLLNRELYVVDMAELVDSKLGQTQKNVVGLFKSINLISFPDKILVLFDEIDSLALDRTNPNDLREMGRVTSTFLTELDNLNPNVVLVATTNLFKCFDKALTRRFDFVVNFDRYTNEDLIQIAEKLMDSSLTKFKLANRDVRLFRKIISLKNPLPLPGDLKNLIRTAVAFSDPTDGMDYFRRLYNAISPERTNDMKFLQDNGFTIREIGVLLNKSKSGVGRELKEIR